MVGFICATGSFVYKFGSEPQILQNLIKSLN